MRVLVCLCVRMQIYAGIHISLNVSAIVWNVICGLAACYTFAS